MRARSRIMLIILMGLYICSPAYSDDIHHIWDELLKKHVVGGKVNYRSFQRDSQRLNRYLTFLDRSDPSRMSPEARMALWINAYNAFTIRLILDHYPVSSILKIKNPWKRKFCTIGQKSYSLDQIEYEILRREFNDPRIHFAVVCASIGCPDLQSFAYHRDRLDAQLNKGAQDFFNSPKHVKIVPDEENGRYIYIHISRIFEWFGKDFGPDKHAWVRYMLPFTAGENRLLLERAETIKIQYLPYDWGLNSQ